MIIPFRTAAGRVSHDEVPDPEQALAVMARHPAARARSLAESEGAARHGRLREPGRHVTASAVAPETARAASRPEPSAQSRRSHPTAPRPGGVGTVSVRASRAAAVDRDLDTDVDPRIAARRDAVERQEQWRSARPVLLLLSGVIVACIGVGALFSPLLSVQSVTVRGAAGGDASGVLSAADVRLGTPLVRVDPASVRRRIEALPWIRSASVQRRWPRTIALRVEVRTLLAAVPVGSSGALAVIDRDGWVLRTVDSPSMLGEVPVLPAQVVSSATVSSDGDGGSALERPDGSPAGTRLQLLPAGHSMLEVLDSFDADLRRRVRTIEQRGAAVVLNLGGFAGDARLVVRLGTATHLEAKASALRSLVGRPELAAGGTVDLSVDDSPVIVPAGRPTSAGSVPQAG